MVTLYKAKASVVKVSVGPGTGNRVARIIHRGGIIPEGIEQEQIKRLEKLGLIEKVVVEETATDADAKAAAEAKAKAAADAKAAAAAKAAADKAAETGK
jgi:hypothetical protein